MNFLGIGKYKPRLDDEARQQSLTVRKQNAELKQIEFETKKLDLERMRLEKQYDIERLKFELYGDDEEEDGLESELMKILQPMLMQKFGIGAVPVQNTPETPKTEEKDLSDHEIMQLLDKLPKPAKKAVRTLSEEDAVRLGKDKFPMLSEKTLKRAWYLLQ
jgi:predicted RNase H-like nuclease (RuvC/YqgF family)